MNNLARERGFNYTRWVDDITISSPTEQDIKELLGAVALTSRFFPVARGKIFFQQSKQPIHLLGHVIDRGRVYKNSKVDREENKVSPLDYEEFFYQKERRSFHGDRKLFIINDI